MIAKALIPAAVIVGLSGVALGQPRQDPDPTGTTPSAASTERRSQSPMREDGLGKTQDNGNMASPPKTLDPAANQGTSVPPTGSSPGASSSGASEGTTAAPTGRSKP